MTQPAPPSSARTPTAFEALRAASWRHLTGDLEAAEGIYRAIRGGPLASRARSQLVSLLREQHRWEDAITVLREHAAAHPDNPEIAHYLGLNLLGAGHYAEGWPLFETRRQTGGFGQSSLPGREWRGEPVGSLLVVDEQGFGDTIQFARFIPPLVQQGIAVSLLCRPELAVLLGGLGARVIARGSAEPLPAYDAWVHVGSLAGIAGASLETLSGKPYLAAPEIRRAAWRTQVPDGARIGLVTQGRPSHPRNADRSLPPVVAAFARTFAGSLSLELGETPLPIHDLADTAAIIESLDLVLAVDTAVAHLAGALGKPCWILLPHDPDWRWLHDRTDSPWYDSVRLYRQPKPGDWRSVMVAVNRDLEAGGLI
jgi:hypothetical protein